jgi:hypothetical protein
VTFFGVFLKFIPLGLKSFYQLFHGFITIARGFKLIPTFILIRYLKLSKFALNNTLKVIGRVYQNLFGLEQIDDF